MGRAKGFTLLELLVVAAIIAVLATLAVRTGQRASQAGKAARARSELAMIAAGLERYRVSFGDYPAAAEGAALVQALIGRRGPDGDLSRGTPCIEVERLTFGEDRNPFADGGAVPLDPWGNAYLYTYRSPAAGWTNPHFVLRSAGPDGRSGALLAAGGFARSDLPENADDVDLDR